MSILIGIGGNLRIGSGGAQPPNANPTNLVATTVNNGRIDLTVTINATNTTGGSWEYSTDGVSYSVHGTTGANVASYSATGLSADTLYYFRFRSFRGTFYSAYSNVVQAYTLQPEMVVYITGLATPLSIAQIGKLNTLVAALKSGLSINTLDEVFDVFRVTAGETEESSLKNLVQNAYHSANVGMTFTAYEGLQGAGGQYLNSQYTPNVGVNFTLDSASVGIYSRTNLSENKVDASANNNAGTSWLRIYISSFGQFISYINSDNTTYALSVPANSLGLFIATRNGSAANAMSHYHNKTAPAVTPNGASATTSRSVYPIFEGCNNAQNSPTNYATKQYSLFFYAKHITTAMRDVIFDAFEAYMDSNGKGVVV